jgi:hypothetical protein
MRPNFYAEHNNDKVIREELFPDFSFRGVMVKVGGEAKIVFGKHLFHVTKKHVL